MFHLEQKEGVSVVLADVLAIPGVRHAFATRNGGVSVGAYAALNMSPRQSDDGAAVAENWRRLARALALPPERFVVMHQVHGDEVARIDAVQAWCPTDPAYTCDALMTDVPGVALCVKTADCVPVLLCDPVHRAVAAVHAGWRGTAQNIVGKVVARMGEAYGTRPQDLRAAVGPAIGPCCYEVDAPVVAAMGTWAADDHLCRPAGTDGAWFWDLPRTNARQLADAGVPDTAVAVAGICTACSPDRFFSHRRDQGRTGRHANVIVLVPEDERIKDRKIA